MSHGLHEELDALYVFSLLLQATDDVEAWMFRTSAASG